MRPHGGCLDANAARRITRFRIAPLGTNRGCCTISAKGRLSLSRQPARQIEVGCEVDEHQPRRDSAGAPARAKLPGAERPRRFAVVLLIALVSVAAVMGVWLAVTERSPERLLFLLPVLLFATVVLAQPTAVALVLEDDNLSWSGHVRRGQVPVADLTEIGWTSWHGGVVLRDRRGRRIYASERLLGLTDVIDRIHKLNPDIRVDLSPQARGRLR
jgi:hypothetical protein